MAKKKVICDTDVMIDYFDSANPRYKSTKTALETDIDLNNILLSAITQMELIAGATNKAALAAINKRIARLPILLLSDRITIKALELLQTFKLSHGLAIPDAMIAATALETNIELFTYNVKDFNFIPQLQLYKP
jgi:predicted nucleic acid-binding protein